MNFFDRVFSLFDNNNRHLNENSTNDDEIGRMPESPFGHNNKRGFHIFSDPIEMHQYFEHQMNEILKTFGIQEFDNRFFSEYSLPSLEEKHDDYNNSGELRDQFLKSGHEKPPYKESDKVDKDVDGKVNLGDLDSLFGKNSNSISFPSDSFFFGKSTSMKTIKHPDGSIETHRSIRDNEGNEELTICRKMAEKEYCVIKKKDKNGKEEVTENFVNLNENEKNIFFKPKELPPVENKPQIFFPFDKFFK
ncbi:hypothetical protein NQ317_000174 [Molorchus minor]|uniref:Uncharacterized protein n=1 Tax=Molorchus minor TaxID=1323400 RepID=A0ABQ9IUQ6_9CUCU|nr:hypothetical protein NQ317_000174 [Molorchus minor]